MARLKPVIRPSQENDDGKCNIKIRITHDKKVRYLRTDYYVREDDFDMKGGSVKKGGEVSDSMVDIINSKLAIKMGEYYQVLEEYRRQLPGMSIQTVLKLLREEKAHYDFYSVLDDEINTLARAGKIGYRNVFHDTRRTIERYTKNTILPFEEITVAWLKGLENDILSRDNKINTVSLHMRNIRTIYNIAIGKKLVDYGSYPFREYRIPKQRTMKRNISAEEMVKIINYTSPIKSMLWARDMFLLSFYLIGINMKDLFHLRAIDYDIANGRIEYTRAKGKQYYSIKVYPEAMEIIMRYPGSAFLPDDATSKKPSQRLLLDTLEGRYKTHKDSLRYVNNRMKRIARTTGINQPLSTYYARHTWATIAHKLGVSRDIIRYALGHGVNTGVTEIYIDFDQDQVDEANRRVIDHINNY